MLNKILFILIFALTIALINCGEEKKPEPKKETVKVEPEPEEEPVRKTTRKKRRQRRQVTGRYKDVNTDEKKSSYIRQGSPNKVYWDEGAQIWRKAD